MTEIWKSALICLQIKNNPESKGEGVFTNDYSSQHDTLKDLTVKKEVTGNQGNRNKKIRIYIERSRSSR